jgi:hypothetical protein
MLPVPTANAYFLTWTTPDNGFALQTNNNPHNALAWSTNGVPQAVLGAAPGDFNHTGIVLGTNRYALIVPTDFPNNPKPKGTLLFRLSKPGF